MAVDLNQLAADDAEYAKQARMAPSTPGSPSTQPPTLNTIGTADRGHVSSSMIDGIINEVEQWGTAAKRVGQDAAAGTATAVKNTMDFVSSQHPDDPNDPASAPTPLWDHAKSAVMDFRDAVAVKDPNIVDGLAQGAAQLVGPFMAYSKALSGLHGVANMVAAGAVTDATALQPHDMRTADLIALGRQTDTKIGAVLRTLGPYGLNAYVNFLTDRGNESEAEGRFKNALDGLGANLVVSPLIHAAGIVVKQGTAATRYLAENGVRNTVGDMIADPKVGLSAQEGKIVFHGSRHNFDEFDSSKIGTGEGAQAYGHGLYFAEDPSVAGSYKQAGGPFLEHNGQQVFAEEWDGEPVKGAVKDLVLDGDRRGLSDSATQTYAASQIKRFPDQYGLKNRAEQLQALEILKDTRMQRGGLYHVDIPDEHIDKMLDWDKPLSEQPAAAKAFASYGIDENTLTGQQAYRLLSHKLGRANGGYFQSGSEGDPTASAVLNFHDVPGIKFFDQGSRNAGTGTRNIVLFDHKHAKIVKKE